MLACVDADYRDAVVVAGCLLFDNWTDAYGLRELVASLRISADYVPGRFYERELPAIMAALERVSEPLEAVIVDGYVWLANGRPGLGTHLWEKRGRSHAVIGVAKRPFAGNDAAIAVLRGRSERPLFVTSVGMDAREAAEHVRAMHGAFRVPTLLRRVDSLCRTAAA